MVPWHGSTEGARVVHERDLTEHTRQRARREPTDRRSGRIPILATIGTWLIRLGTRVGGEPITSSQASAETAPPSASSP